MLPTISIGPLVLPTGGVVYIVGAWVVLTVIERAAKTLALNAEDTYGLSVVSLLSGLIGARLVFVFLHWTAYQDNLVGIIWPLTSGFNLWAGIIFGLAGAIFYGRSKQLPLAATLDALAPGLLVALLCISLADFLAGPGYGIRSDLFWALDVFGVRRHPVQIYEILVALAALFTWWWFFKRRTFSGQLFLLSAACYSAGRLLVDAYRANTWLISGGYHALQILCLATLLITVFLLGRQATTAERESPA